VPKARPIMGIGIVVVVVLLAGCGGSGDPTSTSASAGPEAQRPAAVTLDRLRSLAEAIGHPVYWAGPRPGGYELTVDVNRNIFIRYLEGKVPAGSRRQTSLTVATYPYSNAYRTLESASRQPGATADRTPDGGLVVSIAGSNDNVHIAYPSRDIQIEVYDPSPGRALALATAGDIVALR
jgi:hypothetical protein